MNCCEAIVLHAPIPFIMRKLNEFDNIFRNIMIKPFPYRDWQKWQIAVLVIFGCYLKMWWE